MNQFTRLFVDQPRLQRVLSPLLPLLPAPSQEAGEGQEEVRGGPSSSLLPPLAVLPLRPPLPGPGQAGDQAAGVAGQVGVL